MNAKELKKYSIEQVSVFKEIGLFQEFEDQEPEEIYQQLSPYFKMDDQKIEEYLNAVDLGEEYLKKRLCQEILLIDKTKCLTNHDTEWVYEQGDYIPFLKALNKISQKKLEMLEVVERWDDARNIKINISIFNGVIVIKPKYMGDWADINTVLGTLNKHITGCAYYFVFDEEVIIFLDQKQKEEIEKKRIILLEPKMSKF